MKPRDITITTVLNGWIVKVGCQHIVFNDKEEMIGALSAYLQDPKAVEKSFIEHAANGRFFNLAVAEEQPAQDLSVTWNGMPLTVDALYAA